MASHRKMESSTENLERYLASTLVPSDTGAGRSLEELLKTDDILSGQESQRLRTFFTSNVMEPSRDLDAYGRAVILGDLDTVQSCYNASLAEHRARPDASDVSARAAAADEIFRKRWGPTRVPIYNLILLSTMINPPRRAQHLSIARFLITEAKVPVDGTDVSGSTALYHAISTKPSFDPEYAQLLYDAGADINRRNRYGGTPAHEITMVWDYNNATTVRQACDALRWFLTHGGNLDIKEGDGMTARAMIDVARARGNAGVVRVRKQLCAIAEEEDRRRAGLAGQVCTCCGRGEREGVSLKLCSGCRVARYCSSGLSCQKVDWPRHKISCKKARVQ